MPSEVKTFPLVFFNPTEHTLNLDPIGHGQVSPGGLIAIESHLCATPKNPRWVGEKTPWTCPTAPQLIHVDTEMMDDTYGDELTPLSYEEWGKYGFILQRSQCHNRPMIWSEDKGVHCTKCRGTF